MAKIKKDFSAILDQAKETQVKTPVQKVVPVTPKNSVDTNHHKLSLRMYIKDFQDLTRFVNHMIVDEKNLTYKMSDAISKGIHLMAEKNSVERGKEKLKLSAGRKDQATEAEIKGTTVIILIEDMELLNDIIYHKMIAEGNTKYSRLDLMADLMNEIREENPSVFN